MVRAACLIGIVSVAILAPMFALAVDATPGVVPIGQPISDLYNYSLKLVGLAVFVMLIYAGVIYMLPQNFRPPGEAGQPMIIIKNAVIGLVLLFSAYVILNTINPDLVKAPAAISSALRR